MTNQQIGRNLFIAALAAVSSLSQAQEPGTTLERQLESQYALTTPTADNASLVTTGSVLVLQKKGLCAGAATNTVPTMDTYKDGQLRSGACATRRIGSWVSHVPGLGGAAGAAIGAAGSTRDFVNGEKLYVTKIDVDSRKDAIVLSLISDSYDSVRYMATLRFDLPRGAVAGGDLTAIQPILDQVFKAEPPAGPSGAPVSLAGAPASAGQADTKFAPIPPPPPPPADTPAKSIGVGQTIDEVVAILGQPKTIVDLGMKKIYVYSSIKATFVDGKMKTAE